MANPVIDLLTESQRFVLPYIQSGVEAGLSANNILSYLSAAGVGIRRSTGLAVIRSFTQSQDSRPYVQSVGLSKQLDPGRLPTSATLINGRYSYLVRIKGRSLLDDSVQHQYISVTSDDLITKNEAIAAASDALASNEEQYGISFDSAVVENVFISPLFA